MVMNPFGVSRRAHSLHVVLALTMTMVLAACGNDGQAQQKQQPPPSPVQVKTVEPHQVDVYAEYPGRVQGKQTAQVIGRVNGVLESKEYTEGAIVDKGELLYRIDPKPYQATVDQRKATLQSAQAKQANSSRIWKRTQKLYKANAVSRAERDQALSNYQSGKAAVAQARADLESAQIDLGYTKVTASLTGVTSLREVDLGSLVQANQTRLTTITQLDPVNVLFALPEDDAFARRKALSDMGKQTTDSATRKATIILSDGSEFPEKGEVDFTQSTIDPDTGTVQLRAQVDNSDNGLMPGRYVRARIRIQTLDKAITVPDQAIADSGQLTQVFVNKNGKADAVQVQLGPHTDDGTVITQGLSKGDQVIISGLGALKPGAPVKVKSSQGSQNGQGGSGSDQQGGASSDDTASSNG